MNRDDPSFRLRSLIRTLCLGPANVPLKVHPLLKSLQTVVLRSKGSSRLSLAPCPGTLTARRNETAISTPTVCFNDIMQNDVHYLRSDDLRPSYVAVLISTNLTLQAYFTLFYDLVMYCSLYMSSYEHLGQNASRDSVYYVVLHIILTISHAHSS